MRTLAALCLLLVALPHYGTDWLAMGHEDQEGARRAIYYVMRSFEGAIQYVLIAGLSVRLATLPAKFSLGERASDPRRAMKGAAILSSLIVAAVCCWGAVEHLQAGVCRLIVGIANGPPPVAMLSGLCDGLTGLPLYALGLAAAAFLAASIAAYAWER